MVFKGAHFLSINQLTSILDVEILFSLASKLKIISTRKKITRILEGAILANLFFESSTRTRMSFGSAFNLLGGAVREITDLSSSSFSKGESIYDASKVISSYVDIMVVRHPQEGAVTQFAEASTVPVINAGDGVGEHPTQALLDLYTLMKELGKKDIKSLSHLSISMVGDLKHGRTVHSLSKLLSLVGKVNFIFISPPALKMPEDIIQLIKKRGNIVIESLDFKTSIRNSDAIYMTRIQEERFKSKEEYLWNSQAYSIDQALYQELCKEDTVIMHPLPRNSKLNPPEIHPNLNDHPKLAIYRQAANGIPIRMALFCLVLGIENQVLDPAFLRDVQWYHTFECN